MQARGKGGKGGKGQANGGKGGKGGKGQPVTLTAAQTAALAVRAAPALSSQDVVKKQKKTGKELRQMLAPVPDEGEEPQPGATALVTILTLSERAALKVHGPLGQIALNAIPAMLLEEAQPREGDEVRTGTQAREQFMIITIICSSAPLILRPIDSSYYDHHFEQFPRYYTLRATCNQAGAACPSNLDVLMGELSEAGPVTLAHIGAMAQRLDSLTVRRTRTA
jgi:hypothetical protein